ncbi:hypothetical protein BDB00DRAFT_156360 [Zychaea mexicana]|uniref:uncharacterized protein n=1 Tax=Zychaea mexicana TaxID=64656 RepID=UPI0022FE5143|nr:uncharacterized protein BDB00DRAFT_156360 [Zychaea mexicana]KAI9484279.1 hypothetical protein BDB00DRAFT_156360 [Zychaea mexicana]
MEGRKPVAVAVVAIAIAIAIAIAVAVAVAVVVALVVLWVPQWHHQYLYINEILNQFRSSFFSFTLLDRMDSTYAVTSAILASRGQTCGSIQSLETINRLTFEHSACPQRKKNVPPAYRKTQDRIDLQFVGAHLVAAARMLLYRRRCCHLRPCQCQDGQATLLLFTTDEFLVGGGGA